MLLGVSQEPVTDLMTRIKKGSDSTVYTGFVKYLGPRRCEVVHVKCGEY